MRERLVRISCSWCGTGLFMATSKIEDALLCGDCRTCNRPGQSVDEWLEAELAKAGVSL